MSNKNLLSLAAAARAMAVSRTTLYKWIDAKCITVVYVGPPQHKLARIPQSEIIRLTTVQSVQ
jgi:predicted DNA-binding transcriptional regulator AlpA